MIPKHFFLRHFQINNPVTAHHPSPGGACNIVGDNDEREPDNDEREPASGPNDSVENADSDDSLSEEENSDQVNG